MKSIDMIILALFRYIPHNLRLPAPALWETKVSRAELHPMMIDMPIKLISAYAIPTPPIRSLSFRCPKNARFIKSCSLPINPVNIVGTATLTIIAHLY